MKSNFNRILAITAMALIAVCASATSAFAQNQNAFTGSFTLPNDVSWANVKLPAGDYTLVLRSSSLPARTSVQGPNGSVFILTSVTDKRVSGESNIMTVERRGNTRFVRDLYLAGLGVHLRYFAPKLPKSDRQLAQGPASTEQVLIAMAKK